MRSSFYFFAVSRRGEEDGLSFFFAALPPWVYLPPKFVALLRVAAGMATSPTLLVNGSRTQSTCGRTTLGLLSDHCRRYVGGCRTRYDMHYALVVSDAVGRCRTVGLSDCRTVIPLSDVSYCVRYHCRISLSHITVMYMVHSES